MATKEELQKEILKLNKIISRRNDAIIELKKEIIRLSKLENNTKNLKAEIKLLKKQHSEFKAMAEKSGSECAVYRHEIERLNK